jgi:hypothetical protein
VAESGPWASLDDALDWAPARAKQVVLTYGYRLGEEFSAGAEPYYYEDLPSWPPSKDRLAQIDASVRTVEATPPAFMRRDQIGVLEPEWHEGTDPRRE